MKKSYFTLKEIIIALRSEQLKITTKLEELEKFVSIYQDKLHEGSEFFAGSMNQLVYALRHNLSIQDKIKQILNLSLDREYFTMYCPVEKSKFTNNYNFSKYAPINIKNEYQEEFNNKVNDIYNLDFVKNTGVKILYPKNKIQNLELEIAATMTKLFFLNKKNNNLYQMTSYLSNNDTLYFHSSDKSLLLDKNIISTLLNEEFPRNLFSSYIQDLIDNNENTKKKVMNPSGIYLKNTSFNLIEDENKFVLKKKKK